MPFDKNHPHGVLGASLAMGSRGITLAEAVESKSPGPEWFLLCIFDTEEGPCAHWVRRGKS